MVFALVVNRANGSTLNGTFTPIAQDTDVNLSAIGTVDWVHWGLLNMTSVNRKATVAPQIGNFTVLPDSNTFNTSAYQYTDNYNGYSWNDGTQTVSATNTTTGVYVVGGVNPTLVNGFQIVVPADTTLRTLRVYVGAFAAQGKFQAILSGVGTTYTDTSLSNQNNGPGGVYTVNYAADSANQTLTIKWTVVPVANPSGNVTLQAATLSQAGVDNPPFAVFTSPTNNNAKFSAGASIPLTVNATDADGTVSKVEYYQGTNKLGESTVSAGQYPFTWSNVPPGNFVLTAKVTDNGGASSTSNPVNIFVNTNSGALSGSVAFPPNSADLTAEGTADWAHWGLVTSNSFDHKSAVAQQISNFTKIGTNMVQRFADDYTTSSWSDGTPDLSTNSTTGIFISGITNGFQLAVPADRSTRTLKVYVGAYATVGNFQAYLSDFSAPAYTDTSVSNFSGNAHAVYTLNYAAASPGQSLIIRYASLTEYDQEFGNVTLQSATLVGTSPLVLLNPTTTGNNFSFSFGTQAGKSYTVWYANSLDAPIGWQSLTNLTGNGTVATVTDTIGGTGPRFYRVQAQ
ncbi:MAG: hypothetical protein JWR26_4014 [Pedosphaera sp.]|nr:hypothetical protein [Pedosphaera sp.]